MSTDFLHTVTITEFFFIKIHNFLTQSVLRGWVMKYIESKSSTFCFVLNSCCSAKKIFKKIKKNLKKVLTFSFICDRIMKHSSESTKQNIFWRSRLVGRGRTTGNRVTGKTVREFESLLLRQKAPVKSGAFFFENIGSYWFFRFLRFLI